MKTKILILMVILTLVLGVNKSNAQYDTILVPGTHFTFPVLPDESSYTIGVKNGIPADNEIWLELPDYVPWNVYWSWPDGNTDDNDVTHTHLPGQHHVSFKKNSGVWTYLDMWIRFFVDIVDSTAGSATYGEMPDTVWVNLGETATLSVGTEFAMSLWYELGQTTPFSNVNYVDNLSAGIYRVKTRDNDNYYSFDTIVVAELCIPPTVSFTEDTLSIMQGETIVLEPIVIGSQPVTYLWSTGNTDSTLSVMPDSTLTACVTVSNACGNATSCVYLDVVTAVLNASSKNKLNYKIYPNPVQNIIKIENYYESVEKIDIFNQTGQKVLEFNNVTNNKFIDVSALPKGFYYMQLQPINESSKRLMFIKQ